MLESQLLSLNNRNTKNVLHQFTVDLPKKHGRGGQVSVACFNTAFAHFLPRAQSSVRFARLRAEKRHNYVRKVAEVATQLFISNDKARSVLQLARSSR